jgi:2-amino-4-hydroxy-6-hydroxymethyldihydropteridine diphosphokinase
MTVVYLGLGSNIGEKEDHMKKALELIGKSYTIQRSSPLYLTEPVGEIEQEWFLNSVVEIDTDIAPEKLLSSLKSIERKLGRKKTKENGPRIIDIDILFYGDQVLHTKNLIIPHPRLQARLFVLQPMMDVSPDFIHPVLKKSIRQLFEEQPWAEMVTPFKR